MLSREESLWNFKTIQMYSALNALPLQIDVKAGRIQRQSNKIRIWLWNILFCLATAHCSFMIGRLVQSTMMEPEKYFRWDHFIIHFPFGVGSCLLYYTGFVLFRKNPKECVMVFNQLFNEPENPVQNIMAVKGREQESGGKSGTRGAKSQGWIELVSKSDSVSVSDSDQNQKRDSGSDIQKDAKFESGLGSVRPLLAWPPQYSLDEILARTILLLITASTLFVVVILAIDPSRPQHLYSVLPPEYQNGYSFFGLLAIEAFFISVACCFVGFSSVCQLLFFGKCQAEFKRLDLQLRNVEEKFQGRPMENRSIRRETWILREISKELRELVLFVELFNRVFPPCIFAFKLVCFFSIPFYFFAIRHGQEFPFLGLFTGYGAFAVTLFYGIIYQRAFSIPEKMEQLKREFLLTAHKTTSTPENANLLEGFWAEMTREIGGIRDVGVKVGSFHTLERETTPRFIDFVLKNVVNLLVTFPR